uniref:Endoglucanase n=1 Tax=Bionectria ochroleuca TaxID=29856 RepID=A0A0B7K169_BIOOC
MKANILILSLSVPLAAVAQTLCGQYSSNTQGGYIFNNNMWGMGSGSGSQCTYIDKVWAEGVAWHTDWTWSGGENNVKSYPYSGRELGTKRIVSSIKSISSGADWDYTGSNLRANAAYDIFTSADPNHPTSSGDYEVMIWLGRYGGVYPIGNSVGTVRAAGRDWALHIGYNGAMKVFSFVAANPVTRFDGEIMDFFYLLRDMQGYPMTSQYLLTLQFGTEPFTGSGAKFNCWYFGATLSYW